MTHPIFHTLRCLMRDARANMLVETAIFLPFLVIVFFGVVEITQFIEVKERVNRVANQAADVYSDIVSGEDMVGTANGNWPVMERVIHEMALPHSINVRVTYCSATEKFSTGKGNPNVKTFTLITTESGPCGFGGGAGGSVAPVTACPAPSPGIQDVVVVRAACQYSTMFDYFNFFPSGMSVFSNVLVVPIRQISP